MPFLTPDDSTPSLLVYAVTLPDDEYLQACFLGAFVVLSEVRNWEQLGSMTPSKAAEIFNDCYLATMPPSGVLGECP